MREYHQKNIVKKLIRNLSIVQSILISTLGVVIVMLIFSSIIHYTLFSSSTDSLVESQSREINKQIVLNYENYINSIIETSNYIQLASINLDAKKNFQQLQDIYLINSDLKKDVVSIFLFDMDGGKTLGNEVRNNRINNISHESWFTDAVKEKQIFHFSVSPEQSVSAGKEEQVIYVSKAVEYTEGGHRNEGVILIELNFKIITDLAVKTNLGEGGHILILDDDDSVIYSSATYDQQRTGESVKIAVSRIFGGFNAVIDSVAMYVNINTLSHTRWRIVTVNNVNDIAMTKKRIVYMLLIISLISSFVSGSIALLLSLRISNPLNKLEKSMYEIEQGNFNTKVNISGQKEIVGLAESFNSMIDKIRFLMESVVNEQREKRKTELRALQNQINPHFLYNTLDSIVWLAEKQRTDDVITTVIALARFFRISISKGETFIPVQDEISHIRNYLTIQKIRYVDKFEYTIEIDSNVFEYKVMKLILQPIVENAIYHGVGDEVELITIKVYKKDGFLIFEVNNTGYGITKDRIAEIRKILEGSSPGNSVGMRNVYQRLKLYYGEEADIIITSNLDEMTNIKIIMPAVIPTSLSEDHVY